MGQEQEIVFRKVRGRIIPIKVKSKRGAINKRSKKVSKKQQKSKAAGVFGLGGGLLSGVFGGLITRKAQKGSQKAARAAGKATKLAFKAQQQGVSGEQLNLFKMATATGRSERLMKRASRLRARSRVLEKAASKGRLATLAIGGSLIGAGVENVLDPVNEGQGKEFFKDLSINVASGAVAAAFVVGSGGKFKSTTIKKAAESVRKAAKKRKQLKFRGL